MITFCSNNLSAIFLTNKEITAPIKHLLLTHNMLNCNSWHKTPESCDLACVGSCFHKKKHQSVHLNIKAHNCKWPLLIQSVMREKENFWSHGYMHHNCTNLHLPTVNLTRYYKGPYMLGSKAFNHLPRCIKILVNDMKCFKLSHKRFLYHNSFYSVEEYYKYIDDKDM